MIVREDQKRGKGRYIARGEPERKEIEIESEVEIG